MRIGVLTSGGDSPGMNPAVRAIVRSGVYSGMEIFGIMRGYEGLIEDDMFQMDESSVGGIIQRGGTIIKAGRSTHFKEKQGFELALESIRKNKLDSLIAIGGDGTLKGALALADAGINVVGLPATIDNDLPYTDYTIGFDTAVNTILDIIGKLRDTSSSHDRITIIEVMGRHSGNLALYSGLTGGADIVLVPEVEVDIDQICTKVRQGIARHKMFCIILKAEGVKMQTQKLEEELQNRLDRECRLVVPGHIQRGGSPTARDRMIASKMGHEAIKLIKDGSVNKAVGIKEDRIISMDLKKALEATPVIDKTMFDLTNILST